MLVKNITESTISGEFFGIGHVEIQAGEVKDIHPVVVAQWSPPNTSRIILTPVTEAEVIDAPPVAKTRIRKK